MSTFPKEVPNLRGVCIVVSLSLNFTTIQTPHKLRLSEALCEIEPSDMDRTEAYKELVVELERVSNLQHMHLLELVGQSRTIEKRSGAGKLLTINIEVSHSDQLIRVQGSVHENNSQKHEILEEEIVIRK